MNLEGMPTPPSSCCKHPACPHIIGDIADELVQVFLLDRIDAVFALVTVAQFDITRVSYCQTTRQVITDLSRAIALLSELKDMLRKDGGS